MSQITAGVVGVGILIALMALRVPVAFCFGIAGFIGCSLFIGVPAALTSLALQAWSESTGYVLMALPLFILMGEFMGATGAGTAMYHMFHKWIGQLKGGLALSTIGTCAAFSAASGSSLACVVAVGEMAYPEMRRYGYDRKLAAGSVAAGGTLDILIPPSTVFVVYSALTDVSLGKMILAGIFPGILLAVAYMLTIAIKTRLNPALAPTSPKFTWSERFRSLPSGLPVVVIFSFVIGGILLGWFSGTEAAAIGAFTTFVLALMKRSLTWHKLLHILEETGRITCMVFLIIIMAYYFGYFLALTTLPMKLAEWLAAIQAPPAVIVALILALYIPLGCLMEVFAMLSLTIPIFFPTIVALKFDPIWFGIMVTMMSELAQITPPVGLACYAMAGIAKDTTLEEIFVGIVPFVVADFATMVIIFFTPQIAVFLPNLIRG
jgi:C4-dicarboxylate transporter, DctM subunit